MLKTNNTINNNNINSNNNNNNNNNCNNNNCNNNNDNQGLVTLIKMLEKNKIDICIFIKTAEK